MTPPMGSPFPDSVINVTDHGAKGDDSADDTKKLRAAIAVLPLALDLQPFEVEQTPGDVEGEQARAGVALDELEPEPDALAVGLAVGLRLTAYSARQGPAV